MDALVQIWEAMGFIRWPMSFAGVIIVVLTAWSTVAVFKPGAWADLRSKALIDAILFWGGFSVIAGFLGTLVGMILAFQAIEAAGAAEPTLVAGGIKVAILSSAAGALMLAGSSLIWFGLQFRWRMLAADEAQS